MTASDTLDTPSSSVGIPLPPCFVPGCRLPAMPTARWCSWHQVRFDPTAYGLRKKRSEEQEEETR
jgi:hypothetical protein